ncbi:MAG: putative metal-binding motif-containing protein, partial [Planctomycetota bacterium]
EDCDDSNPDINPGASEVCDNGLDDDCDGQSDCDDSDCGCPDLDLDGYGAFEHPCCPNADIDCNDSDADINPGAMEVCDNGLDDNCDGLVDGNDPNCCLNDPTFALADIDDDCFVGGSDLQFIVDSWLFDPNDVNEPYDANELAALALFEKANIYESGIPDDEIVNFLDFAVLAKRWMESQIIP